MQQQFFLFSHCPLIMQSYLQKAETCIKCRMEKKNQEHRKVSENYKSSGMTWYVQDQPHGYSSAWALTAVHFQPDNSTKFQNHKSGSFQNPEEVMWEGVCSQWESQRTARAQFWFREQKQLKVVRIPSLSTLPTSVAFAWSSRCIKAEGLHALKLKCFHLQHVLQRCFQDHFVQATVASYWWTARLFWSAK